MANKKLTNANSPISQFIDNNTVLVSLILLVILPPIGVIFVWQKTQWPIAVKITLAVLVVLLAFVYLFR